MTDDRWNHPDLHDWQSEVSAGDTLRSFAEWLDYRAEMAAEDEGGPTIPTPLACPECGEAGDLRTIERIEGLCWGEFTIDADGDRSVDYGGETEVLWDTQTTYGIICRDCEWQREGLDEAGVLALLVPEVGR